jgi:hypothetical protein
MIQPFLDVPADRLPGDASHWSAIQREVMLREHPWEWLLANLDTHVDQYVLFGVDRMPLDIDWDHALLDLDIEELDRFTKRNPAIAPLRNALFEAYAKGAVPLDFAGMRRQARRASVLPDRSLRDLLRAWAVRAGATGRLPSVSAAFFRRKSALPATFRRLVRELRVERVARRDPRLGAIPLRERVRITAQDAWQRLVLDVLHDRAIVPWLRFYRGVLERRGAMAKASPPQ